jgi:glycosyltransferase involved in cell wall biosynthesis
MSPSSQTPIRVMRVIARMNVGGPAVQVVGLMRGIDARDFEQRLYTGFCAADEADYLNAVAVDINATRIEGFGRRVSLQGDIKSFLFLVKEIRSFKPDILHTHTAKAGFLGRIASIVSLHPSIRVHTFHGHLLNGYFGRFKRTLVVFAEKILGLLTDQLLAVGERVRQDLLQAGIGTKEKFGLMPPGLILGLLPGQKESQESFGLSVGKIQCAFIGRVTQIKRPDRFLDVVSESKKRGLQIEFFIAGDGELLAEIRDRITSESLPVKVLGWQTNIEKVLAAADCVLLTSDNEGTPLSLIQAGMAARPVVTTNVGSIPEVVMNGVTGIVTNVDVLEMADALEKLAGSGELRSRMGSAAQEFTMANFGVNRLVHDHEELYKKLIANRAKS